MNTVSGYKVKKRKGLTHWEPLLEEWLLCIDRYCRVSDGKDAPYIYTERSSVGVLAGAAWRAGWISLEEFQHDKTCEERGKKSGRADLWLSSGRLEEIVEAKFKWISPSQGSLGEKISSTMEDAKKDAKNSRYINEGEEAVAIAVGFFPIYWKKKPEEAYEEEVNRIVSEVGKLNYHALAWSFPGVMQSYVSNIDNIYKGDNLPGVILVASNIDYDS